MKASSYHELPVNGHYQQKTSYSIAGYNENESLFLDCNEYEGVEDTKVKTKRTYVTVDTSFQLRLSPSSIEPSIIISRIDIVVDIVFRSQFCQGIVVRLSK